MPDRCTRRAAVGALAAGALAGWAAGCHPSGRQVVAYAALDREFSEPVLEAFTRQTGIAVRAKYDDESTKTVGLASLIVQEAARPRCDLFWNNEVLHTVRLADKGLIAAYHSPHATAFPPSFRSPQGLWYGFAARARVLIVNQTLVPEVVHPSSIFDLCDRRWQGKVGIARPIAGTTATHVAVWFATLGPERAKQFLRDLKANDVQVLGGNRQVAQACAAGQIAFGLTDTDDALLAQQQGAPVMVVYPDRQAGQLGTLFIPNTLAILRGAPHRREAEQLVDFLLSPVAEAMLAQCPSRQIPLRMGGEAHSDVETPATVQPMAVDFD
ncbi:MAG: extracellular solute-binding protein, partial [Firmicutes bacterium]|nr:extracellular solute-binding protein [Bacillota bacterium]